jgi:hypothetical protein
MLKDKTYVYILYPPRSAVWYKCKTNDPIRKAELNVGAKTLLYLAQFSSDWKSVNSDINAT